MKVLILNKIDNILKNHDVVYITYTDKCIDISIINELIDLEEYSQAELEDILNCSAMFGAKQIEMEEIINQIYKKYKVNKVGKSTYGVVSCEIRKLND